ncbi:MAG: YitT family protein [Anaerolineae bacterium]|nr:YitT family protein [Anaerolineae bacterium]
MRRNRPTHINVDGRELIAWLALLTTGVILSAIGVAAFLVPAGVAGPGVLGIATIMNHLWATPVGVITLIANIPIQILGYRYLGGAKAVIGTVYYIAAFSIVVDLLIPVFQGGLTDNILMAAIFGGVLNGLGGGLVYRAGGTMGGTSTLARILQLRWGTPLSTTSLYTDTLITIGAGLVFGWEAALAAIITLFITGAASDYVLEGPSVVRTAMIVTDHPDSLAHVIKQTLKRGITRMHSEDGVKQRAHGVLFVTVARPEVPQLTRIVSEADPDAFVVINQGQAAFGRGFKPMRRGQTL